ncbi:MAG: ATP-binding protein [Sulfurimonas sp.]|uniref:nitrate- and nitrite sensing domain-containing protein n=1 Tax=Sulfurimonas sp. TaxID=2022749 RepID=UPI002634319D|nr:nitrate- and nitrite sensing domain-containing protein [Sulfurimonas sp.]MDD2652463.1 ATP-binding protein [Sulfurimonas sp.]MDD3452199.1 ATP-binding protein [Sulfurimonas sp.]
MQLGLKNRLRLISLLPIVILFAITSYYVYTSFLGFNAAQHLQNRLEQNGKLNEIIHNVARERGMSAMYLGNKTENILKSLQEQRKVVDQKVESFLQFAQGSKTFHIDSKSSNKSTSEVDTVIATVAKIRAVRPLVDVASIGPKELMDAYIAAQSVFIKQLTQITENQIDKEVSGLYSIYIAMANAKEASGIERAHMAYILSHSTVLEGEDLSKWLSLIGRADAINYKEAQDKELIKELDKIFKNEEAQELFEEINNERTAIISAAKSGEYEITSGVWFTMLSEKINIIAQAEDLLSSIMNKRSKKIQDESLQVLIVTFTVWFISIILAVLGYILANEIAKNIKSLEHVLETVTGDYDSKGKKINLHTAEGTNLAYQLLEDIIEQTKKDKISAQEASEAKSMFLANMSHEIRTPLNGIVGFTELLKDSGLQEEQSEFVDIIEKSSENLLEIINNILDLSKIESNKLEIENIAFNPILEFESAVEVYAVRASEKHINLGCFIDPSLEFPLKGDPTKLKEVIINLLSNAVKFTNNGGSINVSIRKLASEKAGKTRVKFEIQDSGIGVTSEQKSKIFEAFSQADTSITRKYGGTGLGLTISSNFVELMGGKLDLESTVGEGTTFFFVLDFDEVETLSESSQGNFNTLKALILSDSYKIKKQDKYLREYLDYYGVAHTTFTDISKINLLSQDTTYNLLFVDYDYTNEETLREFSKLPQRLIVLTKSNLMKRIDSLGLDIFKILYEPIHASKIKQALENYIASYAVIQVAKKRARKKFDLNKSKFVANVLVAEDNVINQKLIQRTLEDLGLSVTIANNGLDAFQKRKDGKFDLIFMDIQMPFLDGVEATAEILEWEQDYRQPHTPIVALTANALKGDRERFLAAGLDEYTTKPLVRTEIISVLNLFLSDFIVEADDLIATPNDKTLHETSIEETLIEKINEAAQHHTTATEYRADVLIAKKSSFETKLYTKVIESVDGLTYEVASSLVDFQELISNYSYKVVLFDKEYNNLDVDATAATIRHLSASNGLKSHIVLVDDSVQKNSTQYIEKVDEIIDNVVTRDMLKSIFEKHAK